MSKPWILSDFGNAVRQLEAALAVPAESDLIRAGCIKYFEFCFELAWKAVKMVATDVGLEECMSPKACIRTAFMNGWITDEDTWLEMLEARNRMSHTYNAKDALKIYTRLPGFLVGLKELNDKLNAVA